MSDQELLTAVRRLRVHVDGRRHNCSLSDECHPRAVADLTILGLLLQIEAVELAVQPRLAALAKRRLEPA